ncbi:DNA gyrase subunit [Trichinella pseudospiralis]
MTASSSAIFVCWASSGRRHLLSSTIKPLISNATPLAFPLKHHISCGLGCASSPPARSPRLALSVRLLQSLCPSLLWRR